MLTAKEAGMTPIFYTAQVEDVLASREAGRPIYVDEERIEYRFAANRNFNFHDLAHGFHEEKNGEVITHAMRFPDAYRKFKETGGNEASGTPLRNLPGLTAVQISTLKALSIYTIEGLASVEGQNVKNLGPHAYAMKQSAQKYLAAAGGRVEMTEVMAEIAALKAQNEELSRIVQANRPEPIGSAPEMLHGYEILSAAPSADPYASLDDSELKARIKDLNDGNPVKGPVKREALISMLSELEANKAE